MPKGIDEAELRRRMFYTRPDEARAAKHQAVQEAAFAFANVLIDLCPNPCRELDLALERLEECRMWGNAAIAHRQHDEEVGGDPHLYPAAADRT